MKKVLIIIVSFLFSSCSLIINSSFKSMGIYDKKVKLYKVQNKDKEIVFIPMMHMGTKGFYDDVREKVDSLKKEGFHFYLEGPGAGVLNHNFDTLRLDTLVRKYRKISGKSLSFIASDGGVFDTINNEVIIRNKRYKLKEKIIRQPSYIKLGITDNDGKKVDADFLDLMTEYEKKYGKVILDKCDFETAINEKYNCDNNALNGKKLWNEIILDYRNSIVVDNLLTDVISKIVVVYGAAHREGMVELLEKEGYQKEN